MGIDRRTARDLLASPVPPHNRTVRPRPEAFASATLAALVPYLQDRWQAGCTDVCQLFREIVARGYRGSRTLLSRAVQPWRPPRAPARTARRRLSVRWLLLRPPGGLDRTRAPRSIASWLSTPTWPPRTRRFNASADARSPAQGGVRGQGNVPVCGRESPHPSRN